MFISLSLPPQIKKIQMTMDEGPYHSNLKVLTIL